MYDMNYTHAEPFASPFNWDAASQVGLPTLRDQVIITAASEFDFWQPGGSEWLNSLVEATLNRLVA